MDIKTYASWFHDGDLREIKHDVKKRTVIITMTSAQIIDEALFEKKIELSDYHTIVGKLHLEGIEEIRINDELFLDELVKQTDCASILDFEIESGNKLSLGIQWFDFPDIDGKMKYSYITFQISKYWWENLPKL